MRIDRIIQFVTGRFRAPVSRPVIQESLSHVPLSPLTGFIAHLNSPQSVNVENRQNILRWCDRIDDDQFYIACRMNLLLSESSYISGFTESWVWNQMRDRIRVQTQIPEFCALLLKNGIFDPSSERIRPGTYSALDAKKNPSYGTGEMYLLIKDPLSAYLSSRALDTTP